MSELQNSLQKIEIKFRLLALAENESTRVLERNKTKEIEKHIKIIESRLDEIRDLKTAVQEIKIEKEEETIETVENWSATIEKRIETYDQPLEQLEQRLKLLKKQSEDEIKEKEYQEEHIKMKLRFEEQRRIEEMRLEIQNQSERKTKERESNKDNQPKVKLPKLVITKFDGTHLDWLRFWNQYETEIDKSNISAVGKFSYLKELLNPKVRVLIDGLPFTAEGYERAKNILSTKYGKLSEVVNAHIQQVMNLPPIHHYQIEKIHEFYEKLTSHIQALETMGKLKEINGYVRNTLDKLAVIRADLVRTDDDWQEWDFARLIEAIRKWTERNPIEPKQSKDYPHRRDKMLHTYQDKKASQVCVYCNNNGHRSSDCSKVTAIDQRKKILSEKRLCFNCTGAKHRASECKSQRLCIICKSKHHTSICDNKKKLLIATGEGPVTYPVVVVKVNGVLCRALLDTGAGSSYASTTLLQELQVTPKRKETKTIEMMLHTTTKKIEIFDITIQDVSSNFNFTTEVSKVERETLINIPNPKYDEMIKQFQHLKDIEMNDTDTKSSLPIHVILGASEYSKIKVQEVPRIGLPGEPIAELTRLGWVIISPGRELDLSKMMLTRNTTNDYEQLCNLDVLGIKEPMTEGDLIHQEFKEQLKQREDGRYETGFIWKSNKESLPDNKEGSIARLKGLQRRLLKDPKLLATYDEIIQQQIEEGIIEKIDDTHSDNNTYYMPHKPVVRQNVESTKVRIVYDASARATPASSSLNDCLEVGPALQNLLWSILIRSRFRPIALCGDVQKAFLQIAIKREDQDVLRFHWFNKGNSDELISLRFKRLVFGLIQSPFILNGTIDYHLEKHKDEHPKLIEEVKKDIYVDDLITGERQKANNVKELEITSSEPTTTSSSDQTYAKQQLGVKETETKILGLSWDKTKDTLAVDIPPPVNKLTKRTILQKLASIYDPLGFISATTLIGKIIYRDACEAKVAWDAELPEWIKRKWKKWELKLPVKVEIPRSINLSKEKVESIDIHIFGDASLIGTSAVAYAIVNQPSSTKQGMLASKSRLSKKGLTIPRLELIAAQMVSNLAANITSSIPNHNIRSIYGWSDSSVVLHWIQGNGNYKQFIHNRVQQIRSNEPSITWNYVNSHMNPADLGSRGCEAGKLGDIWWKGPDWLQDTNNWPAQIEIKPTTESEKEAKAIKEIMCTTVDEKDRFDNLLEKHDYWKFIRITTWVKRFISNSKENIRIKGPLTTEETNESVKFIIKRVQQRIITSENFIADQQSLNLQENSEGILVCHGRIAGDYPVYIPASTTLSEKIVQEAHQKTLHGGPTLTIAEVRSKYWIPRLRQLTKRVIRNCYGCKKHHLKAYSQPQEGQLPTDRFVGERAFDVIGTDFAGPIYYRKNNNKENKSYILLFTCSLTRAVHIELVPDQTTNEFLKALKRLIARRGCPTTIYSDNAKSFVAASKWIKSIKISEDINHFLTKEGIKWKFNLSRAPWWGGQFERMVGIIKSSLYKTIGNSYLSWSELEDVLLDVEVTINNRPLSYAEDDIQLPLLTPNIMTLGKATSIPEEDPDNIDESDLRKRQKYIIRCKEAVWRRWQQEYLKALRERHNMKYNRKAIKPATGDVVVIKGDERNKGKWKIGIIEELYPGRDGVVRAVRVRSGKNKLERAVQHLFPLELQCDVTKRSSNSLNANADEYKPKRSAATAARFRIGDVLDNENNEPYIE